MNKKKKAAILTVVVLWSAVLYALAWFLISTFVPADIISHYYTDVDLSKWWGSLFVPLYVISVIAAYFLCMKFVDKEDKGVARIMLVGGFVIGIFFGFVSNVHNFIETGQGLFWGFFIVSALSCFLLFFLGICCDV